MQVISGFSATDAGYYVSLKLVQKMFGLNDLINDEHLRKCLSLQDAYSSNHVGELGGVYDRVDVHARSLEARGVKHETCAML